MFFPLFIAILLGLACPSNTNNQHNCNGGTVVVNSNDPDPGNDPGGDPGDDGGDDGGDDTGGEGTQIPPIPPKNP